MSPSAKDFAPPPPVRPPQDPSKRRKLLIVGGVAIVVMAGFGARFFLASAPAPAAVRPRPIVKAPASAPAAKPTPPAASTATKAGTPEGGSGIAHVPANAIAKAGAAAAAQSAGAQATNTVVEAGSTAPAAPIVKSPSPAALPETTTQLAPGVSATVQIDAAPAASAAVRSYVAGLRISGVMGGAEAKALINGRLIHKGETVDSGLGVSFVGVNGDELVFKDRSGATVTRRY